MVQLLLLLILLALCGLFFFSLKLLFLLRETGSRIEEITAEIVKLRERMESAENLIALKEKEIRLLRDRFEKVAEQNSEGGVAE